MRKFVFSVLSVLLLSWPAGAQEYIRFERGDGPQDAELKIAVESWEKDGVTVDLYGVVHMADDEYWSKVQQDLDAYDTVLYEGVKQGDEPNPETKGLHFIQGGMSKLMGLTFQKEGIDYTGPNMVHADIDIKTLQNNLDGEKLNPLGGILPQDRVDQLKPLLDLLGDALDILLGSNPELQNAMKLQLAEQLGTVDIEAQLSPKMKQAIIVDRNQIVMDELDNQRKTQPDKKRIAIFYGAGHNADFAKRFEALGYKRGKKRWMTAWKIANGVGDKAY